MKCFESPLYQVSGQATIAVEARAGGNDFAGELIGTGHLVDTPSMCGVSDPSLLSVDGSNPNSSRSLIMVNGQHPLGIESSDLAVVNANGPERVHHNQMVVIEDKFGSYPNDDCCNGNSCCSSALEQQIGLPLGIEENLSRKQYIEHQGSSSPNEVGLRAEDRFATHMSILASVTQDGKK